MERQPAGHGNYGLDNDDQNQDILESVGVSFGKPGAQRKSQEKGQNCYSRSVMGKSKYGRQLALPVYLINERGAAGAPRYYRYETKQERL